MQPDSHSLPLGSEEIVTPDLCVADEATFWPWFPWPEFANWSEKARTVVVVPLAGTVDWGLGAALDAEETILMQVLKHASLGREPGLPLLVIPPVRFVLGPDPRAAFPIDPETACGLLEEIGGSIGASGFSKILFLNANPWTEELCKAVARDLRVDRRLQTFCVHLSALGLDFNPIRGGERANLRTLLEFIALDSPPEHPGKKILDAVATRLAGMLGEMSRHAPLPHGGALPPKNWP